MRKTKKLPMPLGPTPMILLLISLGAAALLLTVPPGLALSGAAGLVLLGIVARQILKRPKSAGPRDPVTGLMLRPEFDAAAERVLATRNRDQTQSALFLLEVSGYSKLVEDHGQSLTDQVMRDLATRIRATLRNADHLARYSDSRLAICLSAMPKMEVERCLALALRLQAAWEKPFEVAHTEIYLTGFVGFCQSDSVSEPSGEHWLKAANLALQNARKPGSSGVEHYTEIMQVADLTDVSLRHEVQVALQSGQIRAWFQPQISAKTHELSGFEVLARWQHPQKGVIMPDAFLPTIKALGQLHRLSDLMLRQGLDALRAWDAEGLEVPMVGINFAAPELSDPRLIDRISWELDRADLAPERLAIEVLESVVADGHDDAISRNIRGLSAMGCQIDLDDFGTGHASITSLRRFDINRIKIDRSFVRHADQDAEQHKMLRTILTMAAQLNLKTLAEGVETQGEAAHLKEMGCDYLQGYHFARPLPLEEVGPWIRAHEGRRKAAAKRMPTESSR